MHLILFDEEGVFILYSYDHLILSFASDCSWVLQIKVFPKVRPSSFRAWCRTEGSVIHLDSRPSTFGFVCPGRSNEGVSKNQATDMGIWVLQELLSKDMALVFDLSQSFLDVCSFSGEHLYVSSAIGKQTWFSAPRFKPCPEVHFGFISFTRAAMMRSKCCHLDENCAHPTFEVDVSCHRPTFFFFFIRL